MWVFGADGCLFEGVSVVQLLAGQRSEAFGGWGEEDVAFPGWSGPDDAVRVGSGGLVVRIGIIRPGSVPIAGRELAGAVAGGRERGQERRPHLVVLQLAHGGGCRTTG